MPFQFPLLPFISVHISIRLHCIPMLKSFIQNHRARIYRLNNNIGNIFGSYAYFRFRNMSCWETTVIYIENGLFLWAYFQTPSNRRHWGVWITTDWFLVFLNWWCFFFVKCAWLLRNCFVWVKFQYFILTLKKGISLFSWWLFLERMETWSLAWAVPGKQSEADHINTPGIPRVLMAKDPIDVIKKK